MKTLRKAFIILLLCIPLSGKPGKTIIYLESIAPIQPYERLWQATCEVESNNNPFAVNLSDPNGGSWGIAQIGTLKLNEFNEANGTNFKLIDLFDTSISKQIFVWHCMKYQSLEQASRIWNGGYNGMNMERTEIYWQLIQKCYEKEI
jgi:hypothetical protein